MALINEITQAMQSFNLFYRGKLFNGFQPLNYSINGRSYAVFKLEGGRGKEVEIDIDGEVQWSNSEFYAFRVPFVNMPNLAYLREVIQYTKHLPSPYLIKFGEEQKALQINGQVINLSYMTWVDGVTLGKYIQLNYQNSQIMQRLAADFLLMVQWLHSVQISHGNLNDSNIMITRHGKVVLIDYDTLCFAAIEDKYDEFNAGNPNYQHPHRILKINKLSLKADYFSELVIYLSLLALAEKPQLIKYAKLGEHLLFRQADFISLESSAIYAELSQLSITIQQLLKILKFYCRNNNYHILLPFEEVWLKLLVPVSFDKAKFNLHSGRASITNPCHIIIMLNQSQAMQTKTPNQVSYGEICAQQINQLIGDLGARLGSKLTQNRLYLSIYGYTNQVLELYNGWFNEIYKQPKRIEVVEQTIEDINGELVTVDVTRPVWVDSIADGENNLATAFKSMQLLIAKWQKKHPSSDAPIILHLSNGNVEVQHQNEVIKQFQYIENLIFTNQSQAVVINYCLDSGEKCIFPSKTQQLATPSSKFIYHVSSLIPQSWLEYADNYISMPQTVTHSGLLVNAQLNEVLKFLDIEFTPSSRTKD